MNALTDFIATLHYAPCACMVEFDEFYARFTEWLPADDRRAWGKTETRRALENQHELCRGSGNKLIVTDVLFTPYLNGDVDQSRMNRYRDEIRFIDSDVGYVWHEGNGIWTRCTLWALISHLAICRLHGEEIYRLRKYWRANPVSLSALLSGCK
jgi:hypothetical protein